MPWATRARWNSCSQGACGARHAKIGKAWGNISTTTNGRGAQRLTRTVGKSCAKELVLTEHMWSAPRVHTKFRQQEVNVGTVQNCNYFDIFLVTRTLFGPEPDPNRTRTQVQVQVRCSAWTGPPGLVQVQA